MVRKLNHYHNFWLNAEHNCRYIIEPYVGEPDDGSIKTYDDIWAATSKKGPEEIGTKISTLADGFERYMTGYYYEAPVNFILLASYKINCLRVSARTKDVTDRRPRVPSDEVFTTRKNATDAK